MAKNIIFAHPGQYLSNHKAIETGIVLLINQVEAVVFVKKYGLLFLPHLKYFFFQFTKHLHEIELLSGAAKR